MAETARVQSIDALKTLKISMWKFAEAANVALGDAESEMQRVLIWLETEQATYWVSELRKRQRYVEQCKEAVRMKRLFKDATGSSQSAVDEEKALTLALKRLEEGQQKIVAVKQWTRRLQKEILLYKGQVQRFASTLASDVPVAVAALEQMVGTLEEYVGLAPTEVQSQGAGFSRDSAAGMARGDGTEAAKQPVAFPSLRQHTPPPERRRNAIDTDISPSMWRPGAMSIFDHEIFDQLDLPLNDLDEKLTLTLADKCWENQSVYLEHAEPADEQDSGWYVGSVAHDNSPPKLVRAKLGDLLKLRTDFREILRLPSGTLAVFDGGGVVAVLTSKDRDVWAELVERDVAKTRETQEF
jgi:hypothetical protein